MLDAERRAVCAHLSDLAALTPGTSGNLSVRRGDRFAVTPTGVPYDDIEAADVPVLTLDGEQVAGDADPSSETAMHRGIYRERDAGAVAHTHSPWATTLAVLGEPVPPVHYALAHAGGRVPVADYATYGTADLAANVVATLTEADVSACLVANHGVVATGEDAAAAVETARAVETTARLYCQAATIGDPRELPESELAAVAAKFDAYGQDE
ncbi:class II aldolase/adducin family protein [Halorientalis litorea]|jgi:L-fuculose-phosphate aldolase|uniref:class II aldolase/adducin family protein n=1 Tax=Halorientalis litorea TaxID=2931977 RepID=UPI001FF6BA17|nr:class II aldolase/adducin family protein [Halorientalis litorea]